MITYRVEAIPEQRICCQEPARGFFHEASPFVPIREERVPLFFDGDYDGARLLDAIHRVINAVYKHTARRPEVVLLGRFTLVELWVHLENRTRHGERWCCSVRHPFEEGKLELFDATMMASCGADHFIAAQPNMSYLMTNGAPPGSVVLRR